MRAPIIIVLAVYVGVLGVASSEAAADATFTPVAAPRVTKASCPRLFARLRSESMSPSAINVGVVKSRRIERLKFGSRPSYRASTEDVIKVRTAYPQLAQKIDDFTSSLKGGVFAKPIREIYEMPGLQMFRDPAYAKLRSVDLKKIDPQLKQAVVDVYNRLRDPVAFEIHTRTLAEDAAVEMVRMKTGKSLKALQQGELTETAVLRVLVKRQKAKGEAKFTTLKDFISDSSDNPDEFLETVSRGPFFDKPFRNNDHAMASHLLQRDYVDDVIWTATGGRPELFWNLLAEKEYRDIFWDRIFDHGRADSLANPEEYIRRVGPLLKLH